MKNKSIKGILIIFLLISSSICIAQQDSIEKYTCEDIMATGLDSIIYDSNTVRYKIISPYQSDSNDIDQKPTNNAIVIFPDFDSDTDKSFIKSILKMLPLKYEIREIIAFKSCISYHIYYQAMKWTPEQEERFREEFIGLFYLGGK